MLFSILPRPVVTTRIYLEGQVTPSAHMDALMQHYQAAGFGERPLRSQQLLEDPLRIECMTTGGYALLTGPQRKDLNLFGPTAAHIAFLYETFDTHGLLAQTIKRYRSYLA